MYPMIDPRRAVTASAFKPVATAMIRIVGSMKVNPSI
jgi:hypothetical protein